MSDKVAAHNTTA